MRFIFILALSLWITGCQDDLTWKTHDSCFSMTISNALPVQIWLDGEEPYNSQEVCGVTKICFNQPFQCDDPIGLQFSDDDPDSDYLLLVLDKEDNLITSLPFEKKPRLIEVPVEQLQFPNYDFNTGAWSVIANAGGLWPTGPNFAWPGFGSNVIAESMSSGQGNTGAIGINREDYPDRGWPAGTYKVKISGNNESQNGMDPKALRLYILTGPSNSVIDEVLTIDSYYWNPGDGWTEHDVEFTLPGNRNYIWFLWSKGGTSSGYDLKFTLDYIDMTDYPKTEMIEDEQLHELSFTFESLGICEKTVRLQIVKDGSPSEVIGTSDWLMIDSHFNATVPIDYTNHKDFAGIAYSDLSPVPTFRLRIPAIFFEQDNPAEQEDHELSSGEIVRLYNKLEERRKLDIGFMPQYLHRKLQLVLMHDVVIIDGKEWIRREAYERIDGNKRYPLKRASVWLHDKNYIKENQL